MSDQAAVLEANDAFYRAFDSGDVEAMASVWSSSATLTCIHPGWAPLVGRTAVLESWAAIFEGNSPSIACLGAIAHVYGDTALVVCTERLENGDLAATNTFVRQEDGWKLIHHQASPMPAVEAPAASGTVH